MISVHWGNENTYTLSDKQKTLAQNMVDWGADIIFGNHPHVLQKLTVLTRKDGTKCPVIFAFGNLVSAQQERRQYGQRTFDRYHDKGLYNKQNHFYRYEI